MPTARLPGRSADARADLHNCYLSDSEAVQAAEAHAAWSQVEADHNLPAVIAIAGVGCFFAGLLLGSQA